MTLTREANVTETSTTELVYCVRCERMVEAAKEHQFVDSEWGIFGAVEVCTFPLGYAFCAPPADDGDWACQEPSLEEREQAEIEEQGMWLGGGE
jgi:hypothetical protein